MENNNPKISVLMPVYNGEKYLKEAIESVLHQTFSDFEFLILDDGSTDKSAEIIQSYADSRIVFLQNEKNLGIVKTLNHGLDAARGEFVARMDADDVSLSERLKTQLQFLEAHGEFVLCGSAVEVVDEKSDILRTYVPFLDDATLRMALALHNNFTHGAVMMRKDAVMQVGKYSEQAYLVEDYDLWIRLSRVGKICNLPQILYQWQENPLGECSRNAAKQKKAAQKIANEYWNSFGQAGPASPAKWKNNEGENFSNVTKKRMAELCLGFANGYLERKDRRAAFFHFKAAWKMAPGFFLLKEMIKFFLGYPGKINQEFDFALGVCVLFFEKAEQTIECVQSFLGSGVPIYILNNNSSDKSTQLLKEFCRKHVQVKIFDSVENLGVSGGRNFLIAHTQEKWLFFVDNDIVIKNADWLNVVGLHIDRLPGIEVFIPQLWNVHDGSFSFYSPFSLSQGKIRMQDRLNAKGETNRFPGGASVVNRCVFDRLGLYDEKMFVGFEDFELAIRGIKNNRPVRAMQIKGIELVHDHKQAKSAEDKKSVLKRYDVDLHKASFARVRELYGVEFEDDWEKWVTNQSRELIFGKSLKSKIKVFIKKIRSRKF